MDEFTNEVVSLRRVTVKNVPRMSVLKPEHSIHRLNQQHFSLGDRVVYCYDKSGVPLSSCGTVVGIDDLFLEVLFDNKFMSGNNLDNR